MVSAIFLKFCPLSIMLLLCCLIIYLVLVNPLSIITNFYFYFVFLILAGFYYVSDYCPSAIFDYLNAPQGTADLRNNARKHLSALGWKFWSKIKNDRDEWRYESPKRTYYSLKAACQAIANGEEDNTIDEQKVSKHCQNLRKNKRNEYSFAERLGSKKRKVFGKMRSSSPSLNSSRVTRSNKRVRQIELGSSSVPKTPRTVLSWMIDNNAVVLKSKVFYCKKKCDEHLAEGIVFKEGIRCGCCQNMFSLSGFQAHVAGNNVHRPAENIFLENGKTLVSCQVQLMRERMRSFRRELVDREKGDGSEICNDNVCSICQYGDELIMCDRCPSSFHSKCLNLLGVPEGKWFCPSCCCAACGDSQFVDNAVCCHQCQRQYHSRCKEDRGVDIPGENWYCCSNCEKIHWGLQQLLGKPVVVSHDCLTCTLVKPMHNEAEEDNEDSNLVTMAEIYSKFGVALDVMHECFEAVKDLQSGQDLVEDALFCRSSRLNRLNFKGFYTVLLERNDEMIAAAILRIHGDKVAEIPLIGTCFQYRRLGMCRVLMNEIEKTLRNLRVQKLVLPAAPSVVDTWTTSLGFSPVTKSDRSEFIGYTFMEFQGTTMCQKLLRKPPPHTQGQI